MSTRIGIPTKRAKTNDLPAKRRFTVDEYYCMAKAGILRPDEHLELLNGEIFKMSPIGNRHAAWVSGIGTWFIRRLDDRAMVRIQNPVRLDQGSELEPDIAIVVPRADRYLNAHPGAHEVLLIIEVAETSLRYDQRKLLPYAEAGIPEVWIFDLNGKRIFVHREPSAHGYRQSTTIDLAGTLTPLSFSDLIVRVNEIL